MFFEILVTLPGEIVGSIAHPEHRVEKKLKRSSPRTDDQVRSGNGAGKTGPDPFADLLYSDQKGNANGNGKKGQQRGSFSVPETFRNEVDHAASNRETLLI